MLFRALETSCSMFVLTDLVLCVTCLFLSADENKPIWMHAEEREEQSKVTAFIFHVVSFWYYFHLFSIILQSQV